MHAHTVPTSTYILTGYRSHTLRVYWVLNDKIGSLHGWLCLAKTFLKRHRALRIDRVLYTDSLMASYAKSIWFLNRMPTILNTFVLVLQVLLQHLLLSGLYLLLEWECLLLDIVKSNSIFVDVLLKIIIVDLDEILLAAHVLALDIGNSNSLSTWLDRKILNLLELNWFLAFRVHLEIAWV